MLFALSKLAVVVFILCAGFIVMARQIGRLAPGYLISYTFYESNGIYLYDSHHGVQRQLLSEPNFRGEYVWSPDGQRLAYLATDGSPRLSVFDFDTQTTTRLVSGAGGEQLLVWSPDSRYLAFNHIEFLPTGNPAYLYIMDFQTGALQEIGSSSIANTAIWSPDSRYLAFYMNERLVITEVATSVLITTFAASTTDAFGAWHPDGKRFSLIDVPDELPIRISADTTLSGELHVVDTDHAAPSLRFPYTTLATRYREAVPQWLQDGQHLVFVSFHEGASDLFRADLATGELHNLTADFPQPIYRFWLRGTSHIIFESRYDYDDVRLLYAMRFDGTDLVPVTPDDNERNNFGVAAALSPDERYMLYALGLPPRTRLLVFDFQSGAMTELPLHKPVLSAAWMP